MQPVYDEIQRFILWNFKESNVAIEQILCMEQNVNLSYKNLEVFYEIIPLCFSLSKYDVYYYYDSLNSHILMWMIQMGMGRKQLQSLICFPNIRNCVYYTIS